MSKERWFFHYERLAAIYAERHTDEAIAEMARDAERDEIAERIDAARDRAKEERR